ncbi:MAG: VanZ family protein [Clostridia bacterium]|nr:VanZ family protein [Clostridia bacterium]
MRKSIVLTLSWACVLLTMIMIFCFSAEDAEKSTQTSSGVIEDVLDIVLPKDEITPEVVKKYQFPFRKAAHFGIYMLLGFSLANAFLSTVKGKKYISYICALACGILYAILDEWHQNFSDGRGPSARDVLIDSSGALVGILIFVLFMYIFNRIKSKKQEL